MRNLKYDQKKHSNLSTYYDKLRTLARLSLGKEAEKTSNTAIESITTSHFVEGIPKWIRSSDAFMLSDAQGPSLVSLAQRIMNKRERASEDVNYYSTTQRGARGTYRQGNVQTSVQRES